MIQLVKRLYKVISIFKIKLLKKLNSERTEVYIFDLDNTLYDTWRYLENKDYSNLYLSIPIFRGMKKEIMGKSNKNTLIFFLTARRLKFLKVTKKRLKQDFPDINWHLFMVDKAQEKIDYLFNRFHSEYDWQIERYGKYKAMTDWLQGLALDIPYWNNELVPLAIEMGSIDNNPSDELQSKVINNYWEFMANIILGFEPTS